MRKLFVELAQAILMAVLIGGPFVIYFWKM